MHIFSENSIKIADVIISTFYGYRTDCKLTAFKEVTGSTYPAVVQIFYSSYIDLAFKKTAELSLAHMKEISHLFKA